MMLKILLLKSPWISAEKRERKVSLCPFFGLINFGFTSGKQRYRRVHAIRLM